MIGKSGNSGGWFFRDARRVLLRESAIHFAGEGTISGFNVMSGIAVAGSLGAVAFVGAVVGFIGALSPGGLCG